MSDLEVSPEALRGFGTTNGSVGSQISGAANMDLVGQVNAMVPVFGLIGADYLASFAAAQVLQAKDMHDLAGRYNQLSQAAFTAAGMYEGQDDESAAGIGGLAGELDGGAQ